LLFGRSEKQAKVGLRGPPWGRSLGVVPRTGFASASVPEPRSGEDTLVSASGGALSKKLL